jgi:probable rRNA maturation factor
MPAESPLVEVLVEDERWREIDLEALAERAARAALLAAGTAPERCEISLLAADDGRVAALNAAFRGKKGPTNVLSWPAGADAAEGGPGSWPGGEPESGRAFLGDIALAWETCAREAAEAGIAPADHVSHLVVHGVLHLLGYDHEADDAADAMEACERKALASLGVADPYGR